MVSKNNVQVKDRYATKQVPHYGIRKLSVGVASVLIGTTFYMGMNGNVVHADTVDGQTGETPDSQVANSNSNVNSTADSSADAALGNQQSAGSAVEATAKSEVNTKPQVTEISTDSHAQSSAANADLNTDTQRQSSQNRADVALGDHQAAASNSAAAADSETNAKPHADAVSSADAQSQSNQNRANAGLDGKQSAASAAETAKLNVSDLNQSDFDMAAALNTNLTQTSDDTTVVKPSAPITNDSFKGQTLDGNKALVGTGKQASIQMSDGSSLSIDNNVIDSNKSSAILTFKSSSFKAGDSYQIVIDKEHGIMLSETDIAKLQPSFGTTVFKETDDQYIITDHFINDGTISQAIKLSYGRDDATLLPWSFAKMTANVSVVKNRDSSSIKTLPVNVIAPEITLSNMTFGIDGKAMVYNHHEVDLKAGVFAEYSWHSLKYSILNKDINTLTVQIGKLPQYFTATSCSINANGTSISVPIVNGKVTFTREQLAKLPDNDDHYPTISIHGRFDVPDNLFTHSKYLTEDMTGDDAATVTMAYQNNYGSLNSFAGFDMMTVLDGNAKLTAGDVLGYYREYDAYFADNDYSKDGIPFGTITVINDGGILHKNTNLEFTNTSTTEFYYRLDNNLADDLHNVTWHISIPDGLNFYEVSTTADSPYQMIVTFQNGKRLLLNGPDLETHRFDDNIASVDVTIPDFEGGGLFRVNLYPKKGLKNFISKTYANGTPTQPGDLIIGSSTASVDGYGSTTFDNNYIRLVDHSIPGKKGTHLFVDSYQTNKTPGAFGGWMDYRTADSNTDGVLYNVYLKKPVFYIQIPENAVLQDLSKITFGYSHDNWNNRSDLNPKSISLLTIGDHQFIKVDLSNYSVFNSGILRITVPYSNVSDIQSSSKPSPFLIVSDSLTDSEQDDKVHHFDLNSADDVDAPFKQLIKQEGINPANTAYKQRDDTWDILTSDGMTSATMTKGNVASGPSMNSTQNDHKDQADTFNLYGSIIDATDQSIPNSVQVINVPTTLDGHSQFNPQLTGPIHVVDANTGKSLDDIAHVVYSESAANLSAAAKGILHNQLTADQVTDWSKIKSIVICMDVPKRTSARAVLTMKDPQIYDHVGKTIYVASTVFSLDEGSHAAGSRIEEAYLVLPTADSNANDGLDYTYHLKPITITAGSAASAKLTVNGQSTVKTMVHYKDSQGDHYVELPDKAKIYNELQDTMNRSDFLQSDSDLTAADRILLPAGMVLDYAHPTIKNSNESYLDGYQNGTAAFGQKVKYDFDQDAVVFEGAVPTQVTDTKTVTETIHYVYENGPKAGRPAADDVTKSVEFSRVGFKNPFTGEVQWAENTDSKSFAAVDSPQVTGYLASQAQIAAQNVTQDSDNIEITVKYKSQQQKMTVKYIDDDAAGKVLHTDDLTGLSNETADYTTANEINALTGQHYVLVSDDTKGQKPVYDDDADTNQVFNVHVKHATHSVSDSRTVTETVHYQAADGSQVPNDHVAKANFTRTGTHDEVTGADHWNAWNASSHSFDAVPTPAKTGYTPDVQTVPAETVTPASGNIRKVVTYAPDAQKLSVKFVDDTTGRVLKTVAKTGVTNADAKYNTKSDIDSYKSQHYVLVSDSSNGAELVFDNNDSADQAYEVHLKHGTHQIDEHHTITQTVHYAAADHTSVPDDHTVSVQFDRDGYHDEVTGDDHWNAWKQGNTQTFAEVSTPKKAGYTPDLQKVSAKTVGPTDGDINVTVTYTPDTQNLDVKFIDDSDNGKVLKTVAKSGATNADAGYNTQSDIDSYKSQHYVLVSDSSNGQALKFDDQTGTDQHYVVHLKHNMHAIKEHHTVNETVHYTAADGSKVPADHTANVQFDRDGFNDEVTGIDHWNAWTPSATQKFAEVPTPTKTGYTPDLQAVNAKTVGPTDGDINVTVTYTPDTQNLDVKFIDDSDNGKVLKTVAKSGATNADAGYSTESDIQNFEGQHYILVSDSSKGQALKFDDQTGTDQHYEVHLKHATHAINEHHTVNETIHYAAADGSKVSDDHTASVQFDRDGFNDEVTGTDHWNAWKQGDTQTFAEVSTPVKKGYTPDVQSVEAVTVKPTDQDVTRTVMYTPDAQKLDVAFIDDTTGKTLKTVAKNGVTNADAKYSTQSDIKNFEGQHYVLVSDSSNGAELVFDDDDAADQHYTVHLKHATHAINEHHTVNETIHYKMSDGTKAPADYQAQALSFSRDGFNDEVTGTDHWNAWTPNAEQTFDKVVSPSVAGYAPDIDQINAQTVKPTDTDLEFTVTYSPNVQLAHVKYIDDTDHKVLTQDDLNGRTGETSGYHTADRITEFKGQHYDLVSDNYPADGITFDNNDRADQNYEVHFKHATRTDEQDVQVPRTIKYVYQNGQQAQPDHSDALKFHETKVVDLVDGHTVSDDWTPAQDFKTIETPAIQGYTPDHAEVANTGIKHDHSAIAETVTYNPDAQKAAVKYIDDTTGEQLEAKDLTGVSDQSTGYSTKDTIDGYINQHYVLVRDDTDGKTVVFDHDDQQNQSYEVHLKHGTEPANESRTKKITVHYQYADGSARSGKAADDQTAASLTFKRTGTHDLVTDKTAWNAWDHSAQTFAEIDSPAIDGYTPDQAKISDVSVTADSPEMTEKTVVYHADAQKLSVDFIDDTTGKTLKTIAKVGHSDESAGYSTKSDLQSYLAEHYDLVSDQTNGDSLVFDHDDKADQHYEVHLTHHLTPINEQHTITETIHYQYADGLARSGKAADDYHADALKFSRTGNHDNVTDSDHWNAWTPADHQTFAVVQSPAIEGYTPDQAQIDAVTITPDSQNIEKTVTYSADGQKLTVNFIDDTTGKTLKTVDKDGHSDESAGYSTKSDLQSYLAKHYDLVSDDTHGQDLVFDHDDSQNQVYNVHLIHHTHKINEQHTVAETIHYVYADGLARTGKAADDFTADALKFSRDGFNDEVTGADHWNAWTPADHQTFAAVQSPAIEGYTPDQSEIGIVNVVPTSQSIEKTVTYTADGQKLTVNFIDDTTGETLKTVAKTGRSDEVAGYSTKSDLQSYLAKHYDLVSDATNGADLVFDHNDGADQVYDVHLSHHLTPISDHQVVHETIHYVYADGLARTGKAADDYVAAPLEFSRTGKHDEVINSDHWNAWTPADHQTFAAVHSPAIEGYTPDQAQIDSASVDPDSQDIVKTVTYSADQQKLTVDFIDDTDHGKVIKTIAKTGGSDEAAGYSTKADIQTFVDGHYKLDHDTSNGADLVFDHDDAVDQHYEVHLTHETTPISEATSTKRVIHYQLADGTPVAKDYTAKVDFSRNGFKDLVTNADHWNAWTPNATQTFDAVASPVKAGYTVDHAQVDAVTVEPHHADLETTVTYSPDAQKAAVKYVDDTTGKTLQTKELTGVSDETSAYTTESTINQYVGQHYKLVSDQTNGKPVVFDHDNGSDQVFEVHLAHTYQNVSQEHQVHQTIHYQFADGKEARPDYTAAVLAFSRTGTQDLVTENIQWNAWTPDQTFAAVNTPAVNGYTPDVQTVAPVKVGHDSKDIEQTVVYHADDQTILVNYIDDDTHSTLKTDSIIGKTAQTSDYTTKKSLDQYKGQHYDVVSDDTNGNTLKFDSDSTKVQTYNVHLKHQHQAASDKSTVHQVVHYIYQDGKQAAEDHTAAPIEFTRTGDTDLVTGKTTWNAWTPATGTFVAVLSPAIAGYTPSRAMINHVDVHPGDKDLDTTVTYVPDQQAIVVNYIDQTTGKTLKTDTLNGRSDQTSSYATKSQIDSYLGQHYKLISDDTNGQTLTFDHDDQATQTYDVVLGHQTEAAHRTHEVHETVDYVYADGSQAAESFTAQPIVFSQAGVHDLVTNTTDWNGEWTKPQSFAAVKSPEITGFTANKPEVKAVNVDHQSSDVHELVIYAANAQTAQIKYIDDVTGNTLETDGANGHFNEPIVFGHNVNDQINKFKQAHYKLVSNSFAGQKYQADNTKNVYEVHLTHEHQDVHDTDAVTETVKFQYADGSQAQPAKTQTVNFGRDGIKDLVTGTIAWMPVDSQTIAAVDVPAIDGYTADTKSVPAVKVDFGDSDITKVVTYTANDQTAGIKIIDDTTGKVLNTQSVAGKFGTEIQFKQNPDQQVVDLQTQHYELVSDNFKHQKYQSDNAQNQFEIHVQHQMTDAQRTDDVTETVHYQDNHGNTLHPSTTQTKTFTEHGITDQVTGKTAWTPAASQTMDAVSAPEITGYTPDRDSVPAATVNFGDKDIDQTIVYTPVSETANIKYIDDMTGKTLLSDQTTGDFGSQIKFDHDPLTQINQYEGQGYELVSNSYGKTTHQFSAMSGENTFEVHFKHGTMPVTDTDTVTETIHYLGPDGNKLAPDKTQTITFTRHGIKDQVTGQIDWDSVEPQEFSAVKSPVINGYQVDIAVVEGRQVLFGDQDVVVNVHYTKLPEQQPEQQPGIDMVNTGKVTPKKVVTVANGTVQETKQGAMKNSAQSTMQDTKQLPQTGNDNRAGLLSLIGSSLMASLAIFGLGKKKKHEN